VTPAENGPKADIRTSLLANGKLWLNEHATYDQLQFPGDQTINRLPCEETTEREHLMRRLAFCIAAAAALQAAIPAKAVVLNPNGTGQALVYPYYTANAGFGTLLSLVNTTEKGKALKVHVREGYQGRDVLIFNLYLSPFDVWVAQLFGTSTDGGAALATNDNSCTVPTAGRLGPARVAIVSPVQLAVQAAVRLQRAWQEC